MSNAELDKIIATLNAAKTRKVYRKLDFFEPYPKQQQFFDAGAVYRERLLMAGNQVGKSYCGSAETAFHLTGEYPAEWLGRRWKRPIKAWAVGETGAVTRDVSQRLLCGEPGVEEMLGSGMIPREAFVEKPSLARGVTDAYDTVQVKHLAPDGASVDGISVLRFKTYEQGRQKLQGDSIDFFWCDEEPPAPEYSEILTRITATDGCGIITFTPLQGMSAVVLRFINEVSDTRFVVTMTIDDALHIPAAKRAAIIAAYLPHEREARARGIPMLGSGAVFITPESQIMEPAIQYLPEHWTKLWTLDFGIAHPFAAVLSAWDRDADVFHILHAIRMSDAQPLQHAKAMKAIAGNIPVGWPHDGNNREKGSGETLAKLYKDEGLLMTPKHMHWEDGGVSVETGILEMQQRMATNRFKVASHLTEWFDEYRMYHRKDGLIVPIMNDLLDATRGGIMGKRFGKPLHLIGGQVSRRMEPAQAAGVDFDLFAY
jgi:phage terminase large subunit-like protein